MTESTEVKLARLDEKLDALCHSNDLLRSSLKEQIDDLWKESESRHARLMALEAFEYQRRGGKAMLTGLLSAASVVGGMMGYVMAKYF
jgi:hypothetical protein